MGMDIVKNLWAREIENTEFGFFGLEMKAF